MTSFTLKSGTNKGNRRIWIEGARLADSGFTRGTVLYRSHDPKSGDMFLCTPGFSTDGRKHRIAGTDARPILDLCGKWVTEFIGDHTHFTVAPIEYSNGERGMLIRPVSL